MAPAPVNPPAAEPVAPPVVPADPSQERPVVVTPVEPGVQAYIPEQELPIETEAPAAVESTPSPTPVVTKTAAIPVASADIAGPLKVALAPVAENNPIVQGITVLVLILLGVAYFRALRSKRALKPRLNGK
ncbi:hypothetical protein [Arthrobacter sp. D5-1]|uniref:hypothetical protein n=1 Tax=Arthrobacter sp. D5-1 TaxID=1477518 RepID=UPI001A9931E9|nr:hypothetical protein [Arthrobacter sp. D5-1]